MALILVVDDDPHIREVLSFALEQVHHEVVEATNGLEAVAAAASREFDLIVLDVMMPELDGTEACRRIRAQSNVPIIMLSSRDDEFDRVLGLEIGADDYVTKPFSPRELVARVKAHLRRASFVDAPVSQEGEVVQHGAVRLDVEAFDVRVNGQMIELTPTEFAVLRTLLRRPRKVFTRDELMQHAYDVHTVVSDRTIDSHIRHIREKFGVVSVDPVETVHGLGYRAGACT
ncbi:MAG: response regulator transcription factor [bacterium]